MKKILFVLKERFYDKTNVKSYGLINSSTEISKYLNEIGCETKIVSVIDENSIDKEVYNYKPNIVIIEALWVSGKKIKELMKFKRYEKIDWIVRVHSDIGYLSAETFALKHINDYIALNEPKLFIAPNNEKFTEYLSNAMDYGFEYLPNVIIPKRIENTKSVDSDNINIGCFGALRILKNQVFQAICAIKAADLMGKKLYFHINSDVFEYPDVSSNGKLNPVLNNLEELFKDSKHVLVKHGWMENSEFHELIKTMDLGMQLSFTESFNIVTADFINNNKLIMVSDAIEWMPEIFKTSTINYWLVSVTIVCFYYFRNSRFLKKIMRKSLSKYNKKSKKIWFDFIWK